MSVGGGRERERLHHNGNRALVSHGCEPSNNPLLRAGPGEITRYETKSPLTTSLLRTLQLLDDLGDILRCGARDQRVVLEPGAVKLLLDVREKLEALLVGQMHGFAGAPEDHQALDPGSCEVQRVRALCGEVEGCSDGIVVGGLLGDEEGWDGDVDTWGRRGGHVGEIRGIVYCSRQMEKKQRIGRDRKRCKYKLYNI